MSFDLQIAHSVQEIGQEAWDHLTGNRPFASYRWYRFGEVVLVHDVPIYAVLSQQGEPVARATFWLKRQQRVSTLPRPLRILVESVVRRWPLLICNSPLSLASGLILPETLQQGAALKAITQGAMDIARRRRVSFVTFDYLEHDQAFSEGWPSTFHPVKFPNSGTRLLVRWPDFDSYVKDLSKSVRKDYRRHRNRAADLGVEISANKSVTDIDRAIELIANVSRNHGLPPNPWARIVLENADMIDLTWLTAKIDERLVGCGLLLGDGDARVLALLGLDYSVNYVYFQLVYAAIRSVIEEGIPILRGGGGAYDLKQRLGFELEHNNHTVFAGRGWLLQNLGRLLARSM